MKLKYLPDFYLELEKPLGMGNKFIFMYNSFYIILYL